MRRLAGLALLAALPGAALADCNTVVLADPGWTDVTATTAVVSEVLGALGYGTDVRALSIPVTYTALAEGSVDIFLGNWMPILEADLAPYRAAGLIDSYGPVIDRARYTLATNAPGAALGIDDFDDIAAHGPALGRVIHGAAPGAEANRVLELVIEGDTFGLGAFSVVEASETLLLAEVDAATRAGAPIVFLAWEPHPMNRDYDLTYLAGGDAWFGPDFGAAVVFANTPAGFAAACPNLGRFVGNLRFPMSMVNDLMAGLLTQGSDPTQVARAWLAENPGLVTGWLDGVTTRDGGNAEIAVITALTGR